MRKLFQVAGRDPEFRGKEALASVGNYKMDARDAGVVLENAQRRLRKQGSARAGHTHGDDASFGVGHGFARRDSVSQRLPTKSSGGWAAGQ